MTRSDLVLYRNISQIATLEGVAKKRGRRINESDLGLIEDGAVVVDPETSRIEWIGPMNALPADYTELVHEYDSTGEVWVPELVECHTHLVYAGSRHKDYARRCAGKTYLEIAAEGGGILSTVTKTREASMEELIESARAELERFSRFGVGTIEIKTGYGLSLESEIKILKVVRGLQQMIPMTLVPTFLPAHAVPPEFKGRMDDYVDVMCREWIPEVGKQKLAEFFDVFVEQNYFTAAHARRLCETAKENGMKLKMHVDQFNTLGGTELGIELGATSVDHLDHVTDDNIRRLGESETVAVLLPGASLFTGMPFPPARRLLDAGARVALSTDFNPGTCPSRNLPLMTTLACSQMKMTVPEALAAVTYNAAAALGLEETHGWLGKGMPFRVATLKAESYETLPYCFGEMGQDPPGAPTGSC